MSGLFGSRVLESALGLASVYLLLAMFCSTANEWIAALLAMRSTMLEQGLKRLLGEAAKQFYAHPLIQGLIHDGQHPEHIAAGTFAKAIMDLATPGQAGSIEFEALEHGIAADLPEGRLRTSLLAALQGTERRVEAAQKSIEQWFDSAMDEVSRRYRQKVQIWTWALAAGVTVAANADTIRLARQLLGGQSAVDAMGWISVGGGVGAWIARVVGWALTTAAVSMGAPFWFAAAKNLLGAARAREGAD